MIVNFKNVDFTIRLPDDLAALLTQDCGDGTTKPIDVIERALRQYYEANGQLNPLVK